ncbi:IclR family transcriptional regulator [Methylobacterium oryzihabitans]|uniref:IclR family transcriptional regulator n=1 Tax=Methylobacterium oryzihabitans TaxID=2499852 RepID=A0A3S2V5S5_9HYPH|nr:IclR family transcriptional regulator [Methylobacterium oryzihabitans]RVU15059.1 IclR family transcriptional regulator [Methylobacterium oryzihabitans]
MEYPRGISARKAVQSTAEAAGAQSIDRAATLLLLVGRAGPQGARLTDLVAQTDLAKPTVHRMLTALVRAGLLDQVPETRRYHIGPEIYVLGTLASARFGLHPVSLRALVRLSQETGDTAFLSVARDVYAICLHREDGAYPIRVHALQAGDRHPLGVGAGSLALLAALPDTEVDEILAANADVLAAHYPRYAGGVLRALVGETRARGYALNPGMLLADSWGIGVAIRGEGGRAVGALSIAAIEGRLREDRQREIARLLRREADWVEARLRQLGTGTRASA